jgi:hypothetical protein
MRHSLKPRLTLSLAGACAIGLVVTACGKGGGEVKPPETRALKQGEGLHGAMSYGGQKIEIRCGSRFDIPPLAAGQPADDVRGLRLGVPYDVAVRYAQCPDGKEADSILAEGFGPSFSRDSRGLKIRTSAYVAVGTHPDQPKRDRNPMDFNPSKGLAEVASVWKFLADGMPGKEVVYAIWRTQPFKDGEQPTIQSQVDALTKKYGPPTVTDEDGRRLAWIQTPAGKPAQAFDRNLINTCKYAISASNESLNWGPDCGRTIVAEISPTQSLQQARSVSVAVFDPARLWDYQEHRFETERDAAVAAQTAQSAKGAKGGDF